MLARARPDPLGQLVGLARYTRPLVVKNSNQWCVVVTKKCCNHVVGAQAGRRAPLAAAALGSVLIQVVRLA